MQINSMAFLCGNCRHYFVRPMDLIIRLKLSDIKCASCGCRSNVHLVKVNVSGAVWTQDSLPGVEGLRPKVASRD